MSTIEVCQAYVDAQREYASTSHSGDDVLEYAQKFLSSPGQHDGLFWESAPGQPHSPIRPLVARARTEGYPTPTHKGEHTPYHGYFYRVLTRQGEQAPGGTYDYVAHGHMIGRFALVAFPPKYGDSGVMTFIVSQDGGVYQRNLGPNTVAIARNVTSLDPERGWTKVP